MGRARLAIALLIAVSFATGAPVGPIPPPPAEGAPLRSASAAGVEVLVPKEWRVGRIGTGSSHRQGIRASLDPTEWGARRSRAAGLEAYWVDATLIGVPTDYYYLAAREPALDRFAGRPRCRATRYDVLLDERPRLGRGGRMSDGNFVALQTGICRSRGRITRWASFVAAPGFGPVREMGIPESGMYYAVVAVDGPATRREVANLLGEVSFGGTRVKEFVRAAGGRL
ncbi:MAG TPA: hypothetical protein VGB28_05970 [Actinomycetota bacterium]|jgi:hypothetical protein